MFLLLAGCAHSPEQKREDVTAQLYCVTETCPTFAARHDYTLLLARYEDGECICTLMSDNVADEFESRLPCRR